MSQFQRYRPAVPAGLPPERALPAPARRRLRTVLAWTAAVVLTGGCALAVDVVLRAAWNLSAFSGPAGFLLVYVVVQVPIFACCVALAVMARRREGRLIERHLAVYAGTGWLTRAEVAMLASSTARRDARAWAERTGGEDGRRAMRDFQDFGSELAFLRERMVRGTAPGDHATQELALLAGLSDRRAAFLPSWSAGEPAGT